MIRQITVRRIEGNDAAVRIPDKAMRDTGEILVIAGNIAGVVDALRHSPHTPANSKGGHRSVAIAQKAIGNGRGNVVVASDGPGVVNAHRIGAKCSRHGKGLGSNPGRLKSGCCAAQNDGLRRHRTATVYWQILIEHMIEVSPLIKSPNQRRTLVLWLYW